MKKPLLLLLILALALSLFAGCSSDGSDSDPGGAAVELNGKDIDNEPIKIAMIPISTMGYNMVLAENAAEDVMAGYSNLTIEMFDAGYDPTTQITLVNECISQGFDAIVMEVTDPVALGPVITEAEEAGVIVVTSNMGCETVHTMHIENNSYSSGMVGGEGVAEAIGGKGKVIIMGVPAAMQSTVLFDRGFEDVISQYPDIEIIDHQNIEGFSQEEANTVMRDLLTKHDEIDAVYCCADTVALGTIQAIEAAGRGDEGIVVWGSECIPAAIEAIRAGKMYGTCWPDAYNANKTALNATLYLIAAGINGTKLGYESVPSVKLPFYPVTAENVDNVAAQSRWPEYS